MITLLPSYVGNLNVIGEEIMHLHRRTSGYPAIVPKASAQMFGFADALLRLAGHFDEVAFFPFLEALGLNPRVEVGASVADELQVLERLIPQLPQRAGEPAWQCELPVVYARAAMLAPETVEQWAILNKFNNPALVGFREVGRSLCAEIHAVRDKAPIDVVESMRRCLAHLRVTDVGAIVRTFHYPVN